VHCSQLPTSTSKILKQSAHSMNFRRKRQHPSSTMAAASESRLRPRPTAWSKWALTLLMTLLSPRDGMAGYFYGYNNNNDDDGTDYCPVPLSLCEDSVVQITSIDWGCNGQGAYYWGSSNHRSSKICSINDKVTFDVTVVVTDDINEVNDIYVTLAIQDSSNSLILASKTASSLCDLIGSSCTQAGTYQFSVTSKLQDASGSSSSGSYDDFCPTLIASFSTEQDSGYNLGAANMECQPWDQFASWQQQLQHHDSPREWISDYGMFLGVAVCLVGFAAFLWHEANRIPTLNSCAVVDPCTMELDQYYYYNSQVPGGGGAGSPATPPYMVSSTPQRNSVPRSIPTTPATGGGPLSIPLHQQQSQPPTTSPLVSPPLTLKTLATFNAGGISSPHLLAPPPALPHLPSAASLPLDQGPPDDNTTTANATTALAPAISSYQQQPPDHEGNNNDKPEQKPT